MMFSFLLKIEKLEEIRQCQMQWGCFWLKYLIHFMFSTKLFCCSSLEILGLFFLNIDPFFNISLTLISRSRWCQNQCHPQVGEVHTWGSLGVEEHLEWRVQCLSTQLWQPKKNKNTSRTTTSNIVMKPPSMKKSQKSVKELLGEPF